VDYIISPLLIAKFSNFKALTKPQALKFENLSRSEEKYRNQLVAEGESIFTFSPCPFTSKLTQPDLSYKNLTN